MNKTDNGGDTDCYPEFYPAYVHEEDDSEVILSRLSRNPNERKNFARRIFARFGSKSYSVSNEKTNDINIRRISRSGSTLSVPDALQDMWKKAHPEIPCDQRLPSRPLHKVNSMPSIHTNIQYENKENIFVAPVHNNLIPTDQNVTPTNPNELRRTLSGLQITSDKCANAA